MSLQTLIPPAEEPVSLAEARAWLRLGTDGDDAVLAPAIAAARAAVEARTGLALVSRTVRERFAAARTGRSAARARAGELVLVPALRPVTAIVAVTETGPAGVSSPAPAGLVVADGDRLRLARPAGALVVDYVAGHGAAGSVPLERKAAVLAELAALLARRDDPAVPVPAALPEPGAGGRL